MGGGAGKENAIDYMNAHYRTAQAGGKGVRQEAASDNEGALCKKLHFA